MSNVENDKNRRSLCLFVPIQEQFYEGIRPIILSYNPDNPHKYAAQANWVKILPKVSIF